MAEGYFKIWRSLFEDPIFLNSTPAQVKVLFTILNAVSWKERKWDEFGEKFVIKPGQIYISTRDLAEICGDGVTRQVVRGALVRFEKLGFLTQSTTKRSTRSKTLITVVNWAKYQGDESLTTQSTTQSTTQWEPSGNPVTTQWEPTIKEEGKKVRKKEDNILSCATHEEKREKAKRKSKPFQKPTLEEVQAHINEKGYHFSAEAFVAFYESKGWMIGKNKMKNWKCACTTWEKKRENEGRSLFGKPKKKETDWSNVTGW